MADFAKSIFGFSGFHKKDNSSQPQSQQSSADSTPVPESHHQQQNQSYSIQHSSQQFSQNSNVPQSTNASDTNKFLPKGLSHLAPTTAMTDNSLAYGTTSTIKSNNPNTDFLNQNFKGDFNASNQFYDHHQIQQQQQQQQQQEHEQAQFQQQFLQEQQQQQQSQQDYVQENQYQHHQPVQAFSSGQPVIITTDEKGQNLAQHKNNSQPKGKLKVTIIEGKDIIAGQPYVVCSFESSEFVTNAPGSFGKSPSFNNSIKPLTTTNQNHQNMNRAALPMRNSSSSSSSRPTLYSRQSSSQHLVVDSSTSNPIWNHDALFDVVGSKSELDISVYDASKDDAFLGHVRIFPSTIHNKTSPGEWLQLKARIIGERVSGSIKIKWEYTSLDSKKSYGPEDFEVLRLLGKGTFGQVFQVKKKDTERIYAMKVLSKKVIVKKKEIAHTIGERNILVRTSAAASPFIVGLKFSFQTPTDLYLVTDYMSGGELFWHLQKEGRFPEDRAKFYIAELVLALEHLHDNDIVYRDLKPENILLDANGHIALCDFGLSKANLNNDGTTNTFCGTTEYLAPEVLLDESGYTKMVDFWSLGVLIFEMCCGWSPFYAENTQQMYKNIAFGKVRFPKEVLSPEGRSFVKGLLNRNPKHRLGALVDARELKAHAFFADIDWNLLKSKSIPPPFKPHLTSETDTSNFDPEFTNESTSVLKKQMELASTPLSPGVQAKFKGFTYVDDSTIEEHIGRSYRHNAFKGPGSFIPGNPNLPADEDVIEDDGIDEADEMDIDHENQLDDEFVNGRFDL
ncbi:kinase-like domain-containing protein [Scheffersomyces amazonensis]|uniref:kinase-like domain-containing protein n=1 Tax=Scheffersomyces amazonensis TaxID=1078765 RepID=UPI00315DD868